MVATMRRWTVGGGGRAAEPVWAETPEQAVAAWLATLRDVSGPIQVRVHETDRMHEFCVDLQWEARVTFLTGAT